MTFTRSTKLDDGYTVEVYQDEDCPSPREGDNPTVLWTWDRYMSPDRHPETLVPREIRLAYEKWLHYSDDPRLLLRYIRAFHSDLAPYIGILQRSGYDSTLSFCDDPCDCDDLIGLAMVTRASWAMCMGDSPLEGQDLPAGVLPTVHTPSASEVIEQDLAVYNQWTVGDCYGWNVYDPEGKYLEGVGGYIGDAGIRDVCTAAIEADRKERAEDAAEIAEMALAETGATA